MKSSHTYASFTNLIFKSLSIIEDFSAQEIIIDNHKKTIMTFFVNDYSEIEINFKALLNFLHEHYFFKAVFELIYLNLKKTIVFIEKLNMISFTKKSNKIRSFIKHRIKILKWFSFINRV